MTAYRHGVCLAALIAGLATAQAVQAQSVVAPVGKDEASGTKIEEIVVTARKTQESIIDVPLAVTAVTAQQIEARGITDIKNIAAFTPGFTYQSLSVGRNDRGFRQFTIRGMVPNSGLATRQSVTLFVDGAPISGGNIAGVTDIERIETVKGPQSAFFGRSTFAGAVNFITRPPAFDWRGTASLQYGTYDLHDINLAVEGPIIADRLSFRLSGRDYRTSGQYNDPGAGNNGLKLGARSTKSIALTLFAKPNDKLNVQAFGVYWKDSDGPAAGGQFNSADYNCTTPTVRYICGALHAPRLASRFVQNLIDPTAFQALQAGTTLWGPEFITHLGLERRAYQARIIANYELPGDYHLDFIAAADRNRWGFLLSPAQKDTSTVPNPFYGKVPGVLPNWYSLALGNTQDKGQTVEIRMSSPKSQFLSWLAGVNYSHERTDNLTTVFTNTGYLAATPHTINASHTFGLFGSASLHFTDALTLTGEGRYQIDKLYQQTQSGSVPTFRGQFKTFTPRVILEYKPREQLTVYASYAEGNRPGEFNSIYYAQPAFIQQQISQQANVAGLVPGDKVKMWEVGLKGQFLDNRLRLLTALYTGRWTNRHIPNFVTYNNQFGVLQTLQLTSAAGIVNLHGFELEGTFIPVEGLTLDGTFDIAATKNKRTFSTDALVLLGNGNPVGTQLPFYPKYSGTASAEYRHDLVRSAVGYARVDYIYTGRQFESEANLAWTAPSNVVNLRIGVELDNYRVEIYDTNAFNDKNPTSAARSLEAVNNLSAITVALPNPTEIGMRLSARF